MEDKNKDKLNMDFDKEVNNVSIGDEAYTLRDKGSDEDVNNVIIIPEDAKAPSTFVSSTEVTDENAKLKEELASSNANMENMKKDFQKQLDDMAKDIKGKANSRTSKKGE